MRFWVIALLTFAAARGAITPPSDPITARERAQGYSERVILAKPRADRLAVADAAERRERIRVREAFPRLDGLRVIELEADESVADAIARLQATGHYEFVEPDHILSYDVTPNDPRFASQWALNNTGQLAGSTPGVDLRATAAWDVINRAPGVIVAVVDTGVNTQHEDIRTNLWTNPAPTFGDIHGARIIRGARTGEISDDVGHGSHVAGIIGAVGNNNLGIAGVAWEVQIMVLKNGDAGGSFASDSAACIDYAVGRGAKVINCSFGGTSFSQAFFTALRAAREAGVIVVTSAGNAGLSNDLTPHYPSNYLLDNLLAVGNSGPTDLPSPSSDYGASVDLFAPGTSILSLTNADNTSYVTRSGTSMAAPHVSGALALLRARFPGDTYRQLINRLLSSTDVKPAFVNRAHSSGRLNLQRALTSTSNRPLNDDFQARALIGGSSLALRGNNRDASLEAGEADHPEVATSRTLWWEWKAEAAGSVVITTLGSDYDTTLAIYTGDALSNLTLVAANDNDGSRLTSRASFTATTGASYRISVGGKNGGSGYTQFNLGSAPANDLFAQAATLSGESARATTRIDAASVEPAEPQILGHPGGASLWYRWTAPRNGRFQISAFSFDFDALLAVYTGPSFDQLTLITANDDTGDATISNTDSRCTIEAVAGTVYHIQVDRKAGGNTGELTVTVVDSVWQFSADTTITSSPAVAADGTLYFGTLSPDRRLYAVTPDGALKWAYTAGGGIDIGSPAVGADGTIYFGAGDGKITALAPTGAARWQRSFLPSTLAAVTPAIGPDGTLYTHLNDGYLYALNPVDGSDKWRLNIAAGTTFTSAVVAPDGTVYQASNDRHLYAVTPDGAIKWRFETGSDVFASPALDGAGNIYIATSTSGRVISLTPAGVQRWSYSGAALTSGSPSLSADGTTVYVGSGDRRLHALNAATGSARWTYTLGNAVAASAPAIDSDGAIYIGCTDGKVYAINADGVLQRVFDAGQGVHSSATLVGGMLYFTSRDAKLYAFNLNARAAAGPWPQYAHNPRHLGRAVPEALSLTSVPQSRSVRAGEAVTLGATVAATGAVTYQWFKDGAPIPGATAATYAIASADFAHAGSYAARITSGGNVLTSSAAALGVESSHPGRLINLSILSSLPGPGDSLTMGYVVGGGAGGTKPLLVRAAGPSLATLAVPNVVDDPKLELFVGATKSGENDNWGGTPALSAAFASVGAFPFGSAASRDAATTTTLSTRDNSVKISSANNGTGTVLAELYDLTPAASVTLATPRLLNVSVLKRIESSITIGFVISGTGPKTLLIRAIGPTLANFPFNLGGTLSDPQLALFSGPLRINENNNWGGASSLSAAFTRAGAFNLSVTSRDAALLTSLAPGDYTVQVSGVGGTSGTALVEVYEVP